MAKADYVGGPTLVHGPFKSRACPLAGGRRPSQRDWKSEKESVHHAGIENGGCHVQGWGVALRAESDPWWAAIKELSSANDLDEFGSKFFLRASST